MSDKSSRIIDSWLVGLSGVLLAVGGVILLVVWNRLPPQMPWLYSMPWGEAQLIPKALFGLGLPIVAVIDLGNWMIATKLRRTEIVAARVAEGITLLLTVIYLASFLRVISIMI